MEGQFEKTITLQEMLRLIDGGQWCDLMYVKADKKRGTAGAFATLNRSIKSTKEDAPRPVASGQPAGATVTKGGSKNPEHYYNATRNMYVPENKEVRKVHIRLIVKFNGIRVV